MSEVLRVDHLSAGYGEAMVLSDISLSVERRSALAVLGRNGTGKTTLINSIIGQTRRRAGTIWLNGRDITALRPDQRAEAGIGWVPQERNIFKSLTVLENLTAVARPGAWTPSRVFETFPRLGERKTNFGNQLSGGEQQMLAIGRALVLNPCLLLLDEPLEGLAPLIVEELAVDIAADNRQRGHRRDGGRAERQKDSARNQPGYHSRTRRHRPRGGQRSAVARCAYARPAAGRCALDTHFGIKGD